MGCGRQHAAVRLLESRYGFRGIDLLFRTLVELFHQIPFCASFGVSCSGHLDETDEADKNHPSSFYPEPWGHLNISIASPEAHIQELLGLLQTTVEKHADTSFKKIAHVFGPPDGSEIEIWEMRIGDNNTLKPLGEEYFGGSLDKKENERIYLASKQRYVEIISFWKSLENTVEAFCERHGFTNPNIDER
ncbi:TPA: hypothetical protein DIS57_04060, partial [Candidatus Wolfebacteria bacterium]|nr:hypothetical protein [Candidatus Wolfebacteria bacterium]